MHPNDHKIRNYDLILDETFGKQGTPERAKAEEEAYNYFLPHHCRIGDEGRDCKADVLTSANCQ